MTNYKFTNIFLFLIIIIFFTCISCIPIEDADDSSSSVSSVSNIQQPTVVGDGYRCSELTRNKKIIFTNLSDNVYILQYITNDLNHKYVVHYSHRYLTNSLEFS